MQEETGDSDQNEESHVGDSEKTADSNPGQRQQQQQEEEEKQLLQNGDNVPVRMYRSVVLTSVRQFTDPESPTAIQSLPLLEVGSPIETLEVDPMDIPLPKDADVVDENGDEREEMQVQEESSSKPAAAEDFGYFNAAFDDDFDEQEEVCKPAMTFTKVGTLEVVRGEVNVFNEEDEEMVSSTTSDSSSSSSEPSESGSVKNLALERKGGEEEEDETALHKVFEVHAAQLPSPELPSMEILNSRPITPEDILASDEAIEVQPTPQMTMTEAANVLAESPSTEHQMAMEQVMQERFSVEQMPTVTLDSTTRSESPFGMRTPPSTPAHEDLTASSPSNQTVITDQLVTVSTNSSDSSQTSSPVMDEAYERAVIDYKPTRKVSRDEGTQTELSGFPGRLHATNTLTNDQVTQNVQKTIPLQVEQEREEVPDVVVEAKMQEQVEMPSPMSDTAATEEVFLETAGADEKDRDDDSFYGSDKEVDGEVEFSHTDTSPSGASSSESDAESTMRVKVKAREINTTNNIQFFVLHVVLFLCINLLI